MTTDLESMLDHFEQTHQTVIEIDDFDEELPATDVNVVISKGDATMIVRIGWGSSGLHADVLGYRDGLPAQTTSVQIDKSTSVFVHDGL